jgi:methylenetetrahydrofolate reductase (NADPH)
MEADQEMAGKATKQEILSLAQAEAICPKHMRHGPCGGVNPGNVCEVDDTLACPYLPLLDKLPWRQEKPLEGLTLSLAGQGKLADRLRADDFAVVVEAYPPAGVDVSALIERYAPFEDKVDAVNVAENPLSTPYLSALATAALFEQKGIPTILNFTCRERNLIGLQSDLLGAAALGVQNVFCVTGDHPTLGDHPYAQPVFELDSLELVALARQLRDEGRFESNRELESRPTYLVGAAGSPFSIPPDIQAERAAAKVAAGAEFLQTQAVFNVKLFRKFVARLTDLGTLNGAWLIAGMAVVTKLEQAIWLQTQVPGSLVPNELVSLLRRTEPVRRRKVGLSYIAELISQVREVPGVRGMLLFPLEGDIESIGELIEIAGLRA